MILTPEEAKARYGEIVNDVWPDEGKWCSVLLIPDEIEWINTMTGMVANHIYCNRDLHAPLIQAFENIIKQGIQDQLVSFDGCYAIRDIRGIPGQLSAHSYAIAIDINAHDNKLNGPSTLSVELINCFKDAGLIWGGDFHRIDPMHFSLGF